MDPYYIPTPEERERFGKEKCKFCGNYHPIVYKYEETGDMLCFNCLAGAIDADIIVGDKTTLREYTIQRNTSEWAQALQGAQYEAFNDDGKTIYGKTIDEIIETIVQ